MNSICFSPDTLLIFFISNIAIIVYLVIRPTEIIKKIIKKRHNEPTDRSIREPVEIVNYPRQLNDPLQGPERNQITHISYTNVGYIESPTGDKYVLFGRQKTYRSNQYEYYIINNSNSTNANNSIKFEVKYKNQQEIFDKDQIDIPEIGGASIATIYDLPELRYR
jgi:hypothetical protein